MITVVTYSVVKELYYNPHVKHNATLITTEYTYFEAILIDKLELATLEQTQAFVDRFKLGAKMLVEVLITTPTSEKE